MPDLVVVVPSRGRPEQAAALLAVFDQTCTADTSVVFAVDDNDPTRFQYPGWSGTRGAVFCPSRSMGEALNLTATAAAPECFAVGFMGDDHRPRTAGWDAAYVDALREIGTGIVFGDDLLQGARLATQCAMTSNIIRTLGYMAPPSLVHLYFDNFWTSLGREAGCLRYLPDVVVEHVHPVAGKARWDANYARVNSSAMYERDEAAWLEYAGSQFRVDVDKVLTLRGAHV